MSLTYNSARLKVWDRSIDVIADTLKVVLATSAYTPDKDHEFVSSASAAELSGTGYVGGFGGSGRKTLASKALAKDNTLDIAKLTAADLTWTAINAGTIRYAIVIKEITNDAASLLIACIDINPTSGYTTDGNDWKLAWPATGVLKSSSP